MSIKNDDALWNEYLYDGTDILMNNYKIKDQQKLKEIEATITYEKLCELNDFPLDLNFDSNHLRQLHAYLFKDIYPFAGQYRKVNLQKQFGTFLSINDPNMIEIYLNNLFDSINTSLKSCNSIQEFTYILATLYTKLIYCHPFREGNGRTIREFLREFSIKKSKEVGFDSVELDWSLIDRDELNKYIEVAHIFPGATGMLFMNALVPYEKSMDVKK